MAKREIKAKEIRQDVRAGTDAAGLMEKYNLSAKGQRVQEIDRRGISKAIRRQGKSIRHPS